MTVPHGRTRLAAVIAALLTAALPAIAWAQSPSPATSSPAPTAAAASMAASAAPASGAPGASPSASPAPSATPAWTPPAASGPIALLISGTAGDARATSISDAFKATLDESCPQAALETHTADDGETQAQQAGAALTGGAAVLVIDPVDPGAISAVVTQAQADGATVVALGDTITGATPDFQVAYDEPASGSLIGPVVIQVAVDAAEAGDGATPVPSDAPIEQLVLIDGPAGDATLSAWSAKVKESLGTRATIVHEAAVNELNATEGKRVIGEAIAALGSGGFGAVITPGDAVAAGVIAGLVEAGVTPGDLSITGRGGTLPGVQAIVSGDQLLTTWSPDGPAASVAATLACGQATGAGLPEGLTTTPIDNGTGQVATVLLTPILVTSDGSVQGTRSIETTIVNGQAFGPDTVASICTEDLAQACDDLGLVIPSPSPSAPASASPAPGSPAVTSPAVSQAPTGPAGASPATSVAPDGSPAP